MFNDIFIAPAYPADITLSYHMEPNEASQYVCFNMPQSITTLIYVKAREIRLNCHSVVSILILISIKTRIDNIFAKIFLTPKKAPKMVIHIK